MPINIFVFSQCLIFLILLSSCNNKTIVCEYPTIQTGHIQGQIITRGSTNESQKPLILVFENTRFQDFLNRINSMQAIEDSIRLNLMVTEKLTLEYATTYDAQTTKNHFNFPLSPAEYYLCIGLFNPITREVSPKVQIRHCKNIRVVQDSMITVDLHIE